MGSQTGIPRAHGNLNERAESKARSVERRARDGLASPTQVLLPLGSGPSLYDVTSTILPRLCRALFRSFSFSFSLFCSNSWLQRPAFSVSLLRSRLTFLPLDTLPFSVFPLPLSLSSPHPPLILLLLVPSLFQRPFSRPFRPYPLALLYFQSYLLPDAPNPYVYIRRPRQFRLSLPSRRNHGSSEQPRPFWPCCSNLLFPSVVSFFAVSWNCRIAVWKMGQSGWWVSRCGTWNALMESYEYVSESTSLRVFGNFRAAYTRTECTLYTRAYKTFGARYL